jgi:chromosome segregation ATPase
MTTHAAALAVAVMIATGMAASLDTAAFAEGDAGIVREQVDALPHDEALQLLGEALGDSVEATQSDPSIPEILKALDDSIVATRRIREMVEEADIVTDEQIAEVAAEIGEIADSFRAIADHAPQVFERRWAELASIDAIGEEIGFRIADANSRIEELKNGNAAIDKHVRNETLTQSQIEKLRLTRQANDAEMHSLEAAVAAWNYFSERHESVMVRLGDQSEDLDVFFHALRENARVYEAAAQTLGIANSLKLALSDLSSIENLDTLRGELVKSWDDLMKIVDEVNEGLLLQPGM